MWLSAAVATSITPLPLAHLSTPTWTPLSCPPPQPLSTPISPFSLSSSTHSRSSHFSFPPCLSLSLAASSADAPCHSSYFSLLKFPNWSQLEPQQSKGVGVVGVWGGAYTEMWIESKYACVYDRHTESHKFWTCIRLRYVVQDCISNLTKLDCSTKAIWSWPEMLHDCPCHSHSLVLEKTRFCTQVDHI